MASRGPAAEWLRLNGELVTVPAAICEDRRLFDAVLSQSTWSALSEQHRHHLRTFLPKFDGDDAGREQDETIRRLFAGENFLCGSPLDECFVHLYEGRLTDEIHSLRRLTAETKAQDARVWRHNYLDDLLKELVVKRKLLLAAAVRTPPDTAISLPPNKKKSRRGVLEQRARKRYFQELEQARLEAGYGEEELSPDDNYPEGAPAPLTRKQQRHLTKLEASLGADHVVVTGTASRRHQRGLHLTDDVTPAGNPYEVSETRFAQLLMKHRKRRAKGQGPPAGTRDGQHEELQSLLKQSPPAHSSDSESDSGRPPAPPPAPPPPAAAPSTHWEAAALGQQTHTCFFSLLRDVFCSDPDDRLAEADVYRAVGGWQTSPISPLNDWYQQEASWVDALASALAFLAGEVRELQPQINLVPFLNHGHDSGVYQWIGAGRDSDIHLESLCAYWIHRKDTISLRPEPPLPPPLSSPPPPSQPTPPPPTAESMSPVPPPLYPTTWTVQPSTAAEKDKYRQQERLRYQTPRRAFTYCLHGYRSVVGPVKGGGTRDSKAARGHALLVPDRPAYVTILTLVRDAVARLPNGEGSRSDVLELVRNSGYLAAGGEPLMAGAVSSALDRLHGEADPCVRYDSHRKLWIYLHRHRSEADFEAIDRQRQSSVVRRRTATRRSAAAVARTAPAAPAGSSLLKPRSIPTVVAPTSAQPRPVFTTAPPVPIPGAMQEPTPALSQTELAVQSILPTAAPATSLHPARVVSATHMTASASTAPQLVAHSPTLTATVATVTTLTSPVQQVAGVQSVKVVKNQHAIVQIPSKTPGAAPQLALLANGKLIPIVNQPQSLKSDVRSLSGGLAAARPLSGTALVGTTRPLASTPAVAAGRPLVSAALVGAARPLASAALIGAARPLASTTMVAGARTLPSTALVGSARPSVSTALVGAARPVASTAAPARAADGRAGVPPVSAGPHLLPARPRPGGPALAVGATAAVSPLRPSTQSMVGSVGMPRRPAPAPSPAPTRAIVSLPVAASATHLVQVTPAAPPPRLTSVAPAPAPAAVSAGGSQLKHITIPVSQLSRLLQQQGATGVPAGPLTLAQFGGKQVLIATRSGAANPTLQSQVLVQGGPSSSAQVQSRLSAAVQLTSTASSLQLTSAVAAARPVTAGRTMVLSSPNHQPVLLPGLKGLHGFKLVQLPTTAAPARGDTTATQPAEAGSSVLVATSLPSSAPSLSSSSSSSSSSLGPHVQPDPT